MSQLFNLDANLRQHLKNYLQNRPYREAQPLMDALDQPGVSIDAIQAIARSLNGEYHVRLLNSLQANINALQQAAQQAAQQSASQPVVQPAPQPAPQPAQEPEPVTVEDEPEQANDEEQEELSD